MLFQMFCVYAVIAVIFTYFYQLTFFAGIMVYTCKREVEGRHCLTFRQITPVPTHFQRNKLASKTNNSYQIKRITLDFAQLPPPRYSPTPVNKQTTPNKCFTKEKSFRQNCIVSQFFRTTYADVLLNSYVQKLILILFIIYLAIAGYGCKHVKVNRF